MSIKTFSPWVLSGHPQISDQKNRNSASSRHNSSSGFANSDFLSRLWAALPAERDTLRAYVDRAKSYRNECGCAMGGSFVAITLATLIFYGFVFRRFSVEHWLLDTVMAAACLFGAALLGKMMGIGLGRLRLVLLGRELHRRYSTRGV